MSAEERAAAGARVCERVVVLPEFAAAQRVAAYAALAHELPTAQLVAAAAARGKELLWPRLARSGRLELAAARIDELVPSERGFRVPPDDRGPAQARAGDLLIVPGVAFTMGGARLGRGGGHYDALIVASPGAITLGVAFDIQLVREIPLEPHDQCVDLVITPGGVWRTK
jgi:5-formyltetrahydrofolate cyclo-ligase